MNKLTLLTLFISILLFTSCKKCEPVNSIGGIVVEDAIVRVYGGNAGERFITDPNQYEKLIEVSFDEGKNYAPVDFSQYAVFSLTTTASCSSGYDRNVELKKSDSTVNYTVTITECSTCQRVQTINNWVLTEFVPSYYKDTFKVVRK